MAASDPISAVDGHPLETQKQTHAARPTKQAFL